MRISGLTDVLDWVQITSVKKLCGIARHRALPSETPVDVGLLMT